MLSPIFNKFQEPPAPTYHGVRVTAHPLFVESVPTEYAGGREDLDSSERDVSLVKDAPAIESTQNKRSMESLMYRDKTEK